MSYEGATFSHCLMPKNAKTSCSRVVHAFFISLITRDRLEIGGLFSKPFLSEIICRTCTPQHALLNYQRNSRYSPKTVNFDLPYPLCVSEKSTFRFLPEMFTFRLLLAKGSPSYMQIFMQIARVVNEIAVFCRGFVRVEIDTRRWQGPSPTSEVFAELPPHHPEVMGAPLFAFCF